MSSSRIQVGTATSQPGTTSYGSLRVLDLPTGGYEEIPVIIVQGTEPGPTVCVTANIHGGELTGIACIHQVLANDIASQLRGTLIALPTINPAGLQVMQRYPYYEPKDPNRVWPGYKRPKSNGVPPAIYQQVATQIFDAIVATQPDCLLDLHNASIDSVPFTIRDRVLYPPQASTEQLKQADELAEKLEWLARAFGLSIVNESPAAKYVELALHRSVAGSFVNTAGIPSLTLELGMGMAIDPPAVEAGAHGILNVLRAYEMIDGMVEPITQVPIIDLGFQVRRDDSARAPVSGILQSLVQPGQPFTQGDLLGQVVDIYGRSIDGGDITATADGWLIGWRNGIAVYRGQPVASLAVRDDDPLTGPQPE
ncbi:MAG TPA: succinylglutamate desuccinylase/aspartoacylase family protein [Nitrolancea sp.]